MDNIDKIMNKLKFITLSLLAMAAIFITSCGNDSTEDLYTDDSVDQESDDVTSDGTLQNLAFSLPADSEYYANLMELIPEGESDYLQLFLVSRTSGEKLVVKVELTHEDGELNISLVDDFGSIFTVQPYACILAALTTVDGELIEWHSDEYDSAFTTRGLYLTPLSDFSNVELTLVTTSSSSDSSFDGRGTEAFPYQIYDADGLAQLRTDIASGNTYSGIYFAIDGNIQLMSYEWEPIGTSTYYFAGTLDGGGNSIKNLTTTDSSKSYIGFFYGLHSNAVIKNLTFSDVKITGHSYIGALSAQGGCTVDAVTVTGDMSASGAIIGGLFGCGNGTLSNCESSVNISSESGEGVGGFVAYADTNITFNNCFFNGGNITGHEAVGGMVGETHGTLTLNTCGAFGDITGNHYVGGLVGIVYGDITFTDSYVGEQSAIETVTSGNCPINIRNTSSGYNIGGLIGWMTGASKGGITATITNCHLANEPSLSVDTEAILLSGVSNVGGLVGNVDNTTFTNCDFVNNGAMIKVKSSGTGIGGIMGCVTTCKFTNSTFTNTASITTTDATSIVGGVIGSIDLTSSDAGSGSTIINNNSVVSSGDCVGGCIGQIAPQSTDNKMVTSILCVTMVMSQVKIS